ncbi:hypothetical protein [Streptomyces sp. ODS05-4]|uniref:hypothetical protein n=1 Tax=Streptomyces sp. ODS05-4 TaxID=2944939 RepID=UPI00210D4AAE|nr:hypothetical protein [Streptomyces sp. ODS05-4]
MRTRHHPAVRRRVRHHRGRRAAALSALAAVLAGWALSATAYGGERAAQESVCRTDVQGSTVTAHCHNPYPRTDRVRLHVECARWWDVDSDSAPVDIDPAGYAALGGRCWKEVGSAWLSHQPVTG